MNRDSVEFLPTIYWPATRRNVRVLPQKPREVQERSRRSEILDKGNRGIQARRGWCPPSVGNKSKRTEVIQD